MNAPPRRMEHSVAGLGIAVVLVAAVTERAAFADALRNHTGLLAAFAVAVAAGEMLRVRMPSGRVAAPVATGSGIGLALLGPMEGHPTFDVPAGVVTLVVAGALGLGVLLRRLLGRPVDWYIVAARTIGVGVTALLVERENGTLARLRSLPLPTWQITTAKALVSFLTGMLSTAVLLGAGGFLFDASFGAVLPVAVLVASVVAAATSVMFLIARVARTSEQAGVATSIVSIVLGVGGGAFFPISAAGPLANVLDLNPVAALLRGLGITSAGGGVTDIGVPVAIMLGFAVVMLLVSRLVPDRGAMA